MFTMSQSAQHSVHPTGGSLRVFGQFSWLKPVPSKRRCLVPAHQRVTQTVGLSAVTANVD